MRGGQCRHLAVLVVDSEGHAGRCQQEQGLLLRQLLPESLHHFGTFVGSLELGETSDCGTNQVFSL